jgi:dynein heavy chain
MDRVTWIKSNLPCQILLTVDSISWTTNTELYLQGKDDLFIYDWLEVQNIQLQEGIALLRQSSPGLYRLSLTNLILQNIHQRDIIETLLPCESKEDFRWFQRIRFYYEEDLINIKVMDTYSPYGYEYVGVNESFVMMATTDRCWLSILNSLNRRRVAFLTGHTATGKTQTYRQLSKILAKNSMVFECTPEVSAQIITKIITGISYVGAWICFEEAHRLKPEVMSVLAQHLWRIRDAIANGFK